MEGGRFTVGFFAGERMMVTSKDHDAPQTLCITSDTPLVRLNKATGVWEDCAGAVTFAPGDGELFAVKPL